MMGQVFEIDSKAIEFDCLVVVAFAVLLSGRPGTGHTSDAGRSALRPPQAQSGQGLQ